MQSAIPQPHEPLALPGISPPTRRLEFIDALRGAACLAVVIYHSTQPFNLRPGLAPLTEGALYVIKLWWLGVDLFLVLSGFCLFYPLIRKADAKDISFAPWSFAKRRACRILPPYYAALLLFIVLDKLPLAHHAVDGCADAKDFLAHLLMLHNLRPYYIMSINPAFWSLALECQLYVLFPLLIWITRRGGMRLLIMSTFAVSAAAQFLIYARHGMPEAVNIGFVYYASLPARCFEFAAGMMAAALVARPVPHQAKIALGIAALLIVPASLCAGWEKNCPLLSIAWGLIFASIVVALSDLPEWHFTRIPPLRILTWVGVISYSIYLIHQPLISISDTWPMVVHSGTVARAVFLVSRLAILVGLGYFFHLAIERRFIAPRKKETRTAS